MAKEKQGTMCKDCEKKILNCAMGVGTVCGHTTTSRGLKLCVACATTQKKCQSCLKKLT